MSTIQKPRIPEGLRDLMKELTREILKEKPADIYDFAESYFQSRLPEKENYAVRNFEENLEKYDFSYIKNPQRYQVPVALAYSIIPECLTNLIKDLIKAVLREQPKNLCDFAVEYFRHIKAARTPGSAPISKEINYTAYENYFINKERFLFTPYVKCTCGRTLDEAYSKNYQIEHLSLIHNAPDNDAPQLPDDAKTNKTKCSESDVIPVYSKTYMNSIYVIQKCLRRYLKRKNATTKLSKLSPDHHSLNHHDNKTETRDFEMPVVPQLQINQSENENNSEDTSYTSASTAVLSATESGRETSELTTSESILTKTIIEGVEAANLETNISLALNKSENESVQIPTNTNSDISSEEDKNGIPKSTKDYTNAEFNKSTIEIGANDLANDTVGRRSTRNDLGDARDLDDALLATTKMGCIGETLDNKHANQLNVEEKKQAPNEEDSDLSKDLLNVHELDNMSTAIPETKTEAVFLSKQELISDSENNDKNNLIKKENSLNLDNQPTNRILTNYKEDTQQYRREDCGAEESKIIGKNSQTKSLINKEQNESQNKQKESILFITQPTSGEISKNNNDSKSRDKSNDGVSPDNSSDEMKNETKLLNSNATNDETFNHNEKKRSQIDSNEENNTLGYLKQTYKQQVDDDTENLETEDKLETDAKLQETILKTNPKAGTIDLTKPALKTTIKVVNDIKIIDNVEKTLLAASKEDFDRNENVSSQKELVEKSNTAESVIEKNIDFKLDAGSQSNNCEEEIEKGNEEETEREQDNNKIEFGSHIYTSEDLQHIKEEGRKKIHIQNENPQNESIQMNNIILDKISTDNLNTTTKELLKQPNSLDSNIKTESENDPKEIEVNRELMKDLITDNEKEKKNNNFIYYNDDSKLEGEASIIKPDDSNKPLKDIEKDIKITLPSKLLNDEKNNVSHEAAENVKAATKNYLESKQDETFKEYGNIDKESKEINIDSNFETKLENGFKIPSQSNDVKVNIEPTKSLTAKTKEEEEKNDNDDKASVLNSNDTDKPLRNVKNDIAKTFEGNEINDKNNILNEGPKSIRTTKLDNKPEATFKDYENIDKESKKINIDSNFETNLENGSYIPNQSIDIKVNIEPTKHLILKTKEQEMNDSNDSKLETKASVLNSDDKPLHDVESDIFNKDPESIKVFELDNKPGQTLKDIENVDNESNKVNNTMVLHDSINSDIPFKPELSSIKTNDEIDSTNNDNQHECLSGNLEKKKEAMDDDIQNLISVKECVKSQMESKGSLAPIESSEKVTIDTKFKETSGSDKIKNYTIATTSNNENVSNTFPAEIDTDNNKSDSVESNIQIKFKSNKGEESPFKIHSEYELDNNKEIQLKMTEPNSNVVDKPFIEIFNDIKQTEELKAEEMVKKESILEKNENEIKNISKNMQNESVKTVKLPEENENRKDKESTSSNIQNQLTYVDVKNEQIKNEDGTPYDVNNKSQLQTNERVESLKETALKIEAKYDDSAESLSQVPIVEDSYMEPTATTEKIQVEDKTPADKNQNTQRTTNKSNLLESNDNNTSKRGGQEKNVSNILNDIKNDNVNQDKIIKDANNKTISDNSTDVTFYVKSIESTEMERINRSLSTDFPENINKNVRSADDDSVRETKYKSDDFQLDAQNTITDDLIDKTFISNSPKTTDKEEINQSLIIDFVESANNYKEDNNESDATATKSESQIPLLEAANSTNYEDINIPNDDSKTIVIDSNTNIVINKSDTTNKTENFDKTINNTDDTKDFPNLLERSSKTKFDESNNKTVETFFNSETIKNNKSVNDLDVNDGRSFSSTEVEQYIQDNIPKCLSHIIPDSSIEKSFKTEDVIPPNLERTQIANTNKPEDDITAKEVAKKDSTKNIYSEHGQREKPIVTEEIFTKSHVQKTQMERNENLNIEVFKDKGNDAGEVEHNKNFNKEEDKNENVDKTINSTEINTGMTILKEDTKELTRGQGNKSDEINYDGSPQVDSINPPTEENVNNNVMGDLNNSLIKIVEPQSAESLTEILDGNIKKNPECFPLDKSDIDRRKDIGNQTKSDLNKIKKLSEISNDEKEAENINVQSNISEKLRTENDNNDNNYTVAAETHLAVNQKTEKDFHPSNQQTVEHISNNTDNDIKDKDPLNDFKDASEKTGFEMVAESNLKFSQVGISTENDCIKSDLQSKPIEEQVINFKPTQTKANESQLEKFQNNLNISKPFSPTQTIETKNESKKKQLHITEIPLDSIDKIDKNENPKVSQVVQSISKLQESSESYKNAKSNLQRTSFETKPAECYAESTISLIEQNTQNKVSAENKDKYEEPRSNTPTEFFSLKKELDKKDDIDNEENQDAIKDTSKKVKLEKEPNETTLISDSNLGKANLENILNNELVNIINGDDSEADRKIQYKTSLDAQGIQSNKEPILKKESVNETESNIISSGGQGSKNTKEQILEQDVLHNKNKNVEKESIDEDTKNQPFIDKKYSIKSNSSEDNINNLPSKELTNYSSTIDTTAKNENEDPYLYHTLANLGNNDLVAENTIKSSSCEQVVPDALNANRTETLNSPKKCDETNKENILKKTDLDVENNTGSHDEKTRRSAENAGDISLSKENDMFPANNDKRSQVEDKDPKLTTVNDPVDLKENSGQLTTDNQGKNRNEEVYFGKETSHNIGIQIPEKFIGNQNLTIGRIRNFNEGLLGSISGQRFAETHLRSFWKEYVMNNSVPLSQYYYKENEHKEHLCQQQNFHQGKKTTLANHNNTSERQTMDIVEQEIIKETIGQSESVSIKKQSIAHVTDDINLPKGIERLPRYFYGASDTQSNNKVNQSKCKSYKEPTAFTIPFDEFKTKYSSMTSTNRDKLNIDEVPVEDGNPNKLIKSNLTGCEEDEPLLESETPPKLFQDFNDFEYEIYDIDLDMTYTIEEIIRKTIERDALSTSHNSYDQPSEISDCSLTPEPMLQTIAELSESETLKPSDHLTSIDDDFLANFEKISDSTNTSWTTCSKEDNSFISDEFLEEKQNSEFITTKTSASRDAQGGIYEFTKEQMVKRETILQNAQIQSIAQAPSPPNYDPFYEDIQEPAAKTIQQVFRQYMQRKYKSEDKQAQTFCENNSINNNENVKLNNENIVTASKDNLINKTSNETILNATDNLIQEERNSHSKPISENGNKTNQVSSEIASPGDMVLKNVLKSVLVTNHDNSEDFIKNAKNNKTIVHETISSPIQAYHTNLTSHDSQEPLNKSLNHVPNDPIIEQNIKEEYFNNLEGLNLIDEEKSSNEENKDLPQKNEIKESVTDLKNQDISKHFENNKYDSGANNLISNCTDNSNEFEKHQFKGESNPSTVKPNSHDLEATEQNVNLQTESCNGAKKHVSKDVNGWETTDELNNEVVVNSLGGLTADAEEGNNNAKISPNNDYTSNLSDVIESSSDLKNQSISSIENRKFGIDHSQADTNTQHIKNDSETNKNFSKPDANSEIANPKEECSPAIEHIIEDSDKKIVINSVVDSKEEMKNVKIKAKEENNSKDKPIQNKIPELKSIHIKKNSQNIENEANDLNTNKNILKSSGSSKTRSSDKLETGNCETENDITKEKRVYKDECHSTVEHSADKNYAVDIKSSDDLKIVVENQLQEDHTTTALEYSNDVLRQEVSGFQNNEFKSIENNSDILELSKNIQSKNANTDNETLGYINDEKVLSKEQFSFKPTAPTEEDVNLVESLDNLKSNQNLLDQAATKIQNALRVFIKRKSDLGTKKETAKYNWFVGDEPIVTKSSLTKTTSEIPFEETEAYIELTTNPTQYLVDSSSNLEAIDANNFSRSPTAPVSNRSKSSVALATDNSNNISKDTVSAEESDANVNSDSKDTNQHANHLNHKDSKHENFAVFKKDTTLKYTKLIDQFINFERHYSEVVNQSNQNSEITTENKFKIPDIDEITKILADFTDAQKHKCDSAIPYHRLENSCIGTDKDPITDSAANTDTCSSSDVDDTEDSLSTKTVKLQKPDMAISKMQQRRDSTTKLPLLDKPKDYNFDEPLIPAIGNLDIDEEEIVVNKLQREDTRESSGQSDVDVIIGGDKDDNIYFLDNIDIDPTFPAKGSLKRVYTVAGESDAKSLLKNVTIDESIKYIEPPDYEVNSGSLCLDDDTDENIRRKMMAYSLSETDSDCFDKNATKDESSSSDSKTQKYDDFNVSTALVENGNSSTETESTIVSAVTKIQAGARGYLTRKRLGKTEQNKASFGNAAISESLEYLVQEAAAKKIQKVFRQYYRKKLKSGYPKEVESSLPEFATSMENTLAQKRSIMLQRGDALRNDSTPDEGNSSSNGSGTENIKLNKKNQEKDKNKTLSNSEESNNSDKQRIDEDISRKGVPDTLSAGKTAAAIRAKKIEENKKRWLAMRQNSMPVQIDSEVLRVIPKYMRKKIRSAEGEKKRDRRQALMD